MAKLSAHGHELGRIERIETLERTGTTYRVIVSFRSDGHIMRRMVALNIHDTYYGGSPHADYGWKLWRRFKPEVYKNPSKLRESVEKRLERARERGDKVT